LRRVSAYGEQGCGEHGEREASRPATRDLLQDGFMISSWGLPVEPL
jgi:hypothetical protein